MESRTLKQAIDGSFLLGAAISIRALDDPAQVDLLTREFDQITAENVMKPMHVQPRPGEFTFDAGDRIANFARDNGMTMIGHTLAWHQQTPAWFTQQPDGAPLSREAALSHLREHIFTVMRHFRGRVLGWDVVNEATSDKEGEFLRDAPLRRAIGDDYVAQAFRFAAEADPDTKLYYNDYGAERPPKRERIVRLLNELKRDGVRVDGIGWQAHLGLKWEPGVDARTHEPTRAPWADEIEPTILALHAACPNVMVTELDLDVLPWPATGMGTVLTDENRDAIDPFRDGVPDHVHAAQSQLYAELFDAFEKHRDKLSRATFWCVNDGQSWLNNWPVKGRTTHPLLFDRANRPKPAYYAARDAVLRCKRGRSPFSSKEAIR